MSADHSTWRVFFSLPFLFILGVGLQTACRKGAAADLPPARKLPVYNLLITEPNLEALGRAQGNETVPGTFVHEGESIPVKIRHRGAWARGWLKKPLKVFFPDNHPFQGQSRINLNSGWRDPAFIREHLAYAIFERCGVPCSKTRPVRVSVNGKFHGVFTELEQPDKHFLKRRNLKGAVVYKAFSGAADERDLGPMPAYPQNYEKQTQKTGDFRDLQEFCRDLRKATNVVDFFERRVDLVKYVNFLAANILTQNWDGYNKNHFIVRHADESRWFAVPWDLDRTLGDSWDNRFNEYRFPLEMGVQNRPGITGWNRLQNRFFQSPELRRKLADRLEQLIRTEFTDEKLMPFIDQLEADLKEEMKRDREAWPGAGQPLGSGIQELKIFIRNQRSFVLAELPKLR